MTTVMNLVERAAELNEDGVYELADGSFPDAVQSFENAVRQMMQVCEQTTQAHLEQQRQQQQERRLQQQLASSSSSSAAACNCPAPRCSNKSHAAASAESSSTSNTSCLPPTRSSVEVPYLKDDRFFIYSCTVTFHPTPSQHHTVPTSAEIAFYCATILFNLALAHHQQGQRTAGPERAASLRQALVLYQEASKALQTLQQRLAPHEVASCGDDLLLMSLAIWNNQACILVALREPTAAQTCFQHVFARSRLVLEDPSGNNFSLFEQSQIQEFLRNAMVFGTLFQAGGLLLEPAAACA